MTFRLLPLLLSLSLLVIGLTGCGGAEAEPDSAAVSSITITPVGNQMEFEQTEFTVTAGTEITLTFDNTATSPAMEHNVILLNDNADATINRVGQAAMAAASNAYVPEDDAVLAATDLAKPGETVTLTFTAPSEPGEYAYICTFPGHYAMMQGVMRVIQ
jgi:azurin